MCGHGALDGASNVPAMNWTGPMLYRQQLTDQRISQKGLKSK